MKKLKKIVKNEDGQALVFFALLLVVLLGVAALVVDVGMMRVTKVEMQTAADAAALAGAQDLLNGGDAEGTAVYYAEKNGAENTMLPEQEDPTKIEVVCTKNVNYTFARILGFEKKEVSARAVADISSVKSASGVVPLGVESQTLEYGETYVLKENAGAGSYHGNFNCLALGGQGAKVFGKNLKFGYDGILTIGDKIDTEPGNMAGKTAEGLSYRIEQDPTATFETVKKGSARICVVPVVNTLEVNGRKEVTIVGFAVFFLESSGKTGNGNNAEAFINGKFMEMVIGNSTGGAVTSYGAYKVKLIE